MASPITDPDVPYVGRITGGFDDGRLVRIQGYTAPIAQRFNVNLQCDGSEDADIGVHLSIRLQEGYVARNSYHNGEWGDEQDNGNLLIGTGQKFEIIVLSAATSYKVAINGQHFCEFPHRITPSKITHLKIDGDVSISLISYEGGDMAKTSSTQQNTAYGQQPQQNYGGYGGYAPPPQAGYGGYGPAPGQGPQGPYGPPLQGGYQPYGQQGGYGAPGAPPGYQPVPAAGINLPSAPTAPSAPPNLDDDGTPNSMYPNVPNQKCNNPYPPISPASGRNLPPYPTLPAPGGNGPGYPPGSYQFPPSTAGSSPYPSVPSYPPTTTPGRQGMNSYPGFRPPAPGALQPVQNVSPYPTNPLPAAGYPQPSIYSNYPRYPSSVPAYAQTPNFTGYGGYAGSTGNSAVPQGYSVYKPQEKYQKESSTTMDKVKKYGLPILGAGAATYALSKLTGGFGLGSSDSDSD